MHSARSRDSHRPERMAGETRGHADAAVAEAEASRWAARAGRRRAQQVEMGGDAGIRFQQRGRGGHAPLLCNPPTRPGRGCHVPRRAGAASRSRAGCRCWPPAPCWSRPASIHAGRRRCGGRLPSASSCSMLAADAGLACARETRAGPCLAHELLPDRGGQCGAQATVVPPVRHVRAERGERAPRRLCRRRRRTLWLLPTSDSPRVVVRSATAVLQHVTQGC